MHTRRRLIFNSLLLCLCAEFVGEGIRLYRLPQQALGAETLALLDNVQKVETFRLSSDVKDVERRQISDYPLKYKGNAQGQAFARRIANILRKPQTYWGSNDTTCIVDPGVAYRLWSGRRCVELMICFHCGQMLIATKNETGQVTHFAYTEFASVRPELIELAKQAFPNDADIAALQ